MAVQSPHADVIPTSDVATPAPPADLADHVRELVDTFPPLDESQRSRLAVLLRGAA
jgi:hypothetical protein